MRKKEVLRAAWQEFKSRILGCFASIKEAARKLLGKQMVINLVPESDDLQKLDAYSLRRQRLAPHQYSIFRYMKSEFLKR